MSKLAFAFYYSGFLGLLAAYTVKVVGAVAFGALVAAGTPAALVALLAAYGVTAGSAGVVTAWVGTGYFARKLYENLFDAADYGRLLEGSIAPKDIMTALPGAAKTARRCRHSLRRFLPA